MTKISAGSAVDPHAASRTLFALLVVILAAIGLYAIFVTGPAVRAVAQANIENAVSAENVAFCEKFGMHAGSRQFVACSQELMAIRKKQTDRDSEAGML